jgi:hypothetical protein
MEVDWERATERMYPYYSNSKPGVAIPSQHLNELEKGYLIQNPGWFLIV